MLLLITILAILGNLLLGLFVLTKNPKNTINRLLFLANIINACWALSNYFSIIPPLGTDLILWIRLVMFFAVMHVASFVLLISYFPNGISNNKKPYVYAYLVLVFEMLIVALSPYLFTNVVFAPNGAQPVPGPFMPFFGLYILTSITFALIVLINKFRKSKGMLRAQLAYILMGTAVMFGLILCTIFIPVIFFQNSYFVAYAPLYTYPFVVSLVYIIVKHGFMDIRIVVARSVAYTLLVLILAGFYTGSIFVISRYILGGAISEIQAPIYFILALFIGFTFNPLRKLLEVITDKVFFKGKYSANDLILKLTQIMASTLFLEELSKRTLVQLLNTMRISGGAFVLFGKRNNIYIIKEGDFVDLSKHKEKYDKLIQLKRIAVLDEEENNSIKNLMRSLNVVVSLPLSDDKSEKGLLLLGEKKSGEVYSQEDIEVLKIFGPEVTVALHNAESYEEISKFNITLKEKVENATTDLKQANDKLKELDLLKNEFVSVASHELRTPMTAIKSYLWMALQGKGGELNEKQKYYIERGFNSVDRLIRLVNDMLNISRIESGKITIEMQSIDIKMLTKEVVDEVMPRAEEIGVKLIVEEPTEKLPNVVADSDKIKEVLFNLIGNSLKFTPKDGSITVKFALQDGMIVTTVTDTGNGIAAEDIDKLFQKFGLLPGSYTTNQPAMGTGLGLYICREIIEMHHGKIWAESEGKGKGTTMTFTLKQYSDREKENLTTLKPGDQKEKMELIHSQV